MRWALITAMILTLALLPLVQSTQEGNEVRIYLFWGKGCPHCAKEKLFLEEMKSKYPLRVVEYEVYYNETNREKFLEMCRKYGITPMGVPTTFIGDKYFIGFNDEIAEEIENEIKRELEELDTGKSCETKIPIIGCINPKNVSLPAFTVLIAILDGFNPCAMWVLCFLLTLLVYTRSRKKMLLVGSIFVSASAIVYFMFMAAWLNLFLILGYKDWLRIGVGILAISMGLINVKDFLFFKKGVSLTIPERAKPGLFRRMRKVVRGGELPATIAGTVILAVTANFIELLCTAGFPAIYTRILTLQKLSLLEYYLYLALYNIVYVIPLLAIVLFFVYTMGKRKLTEREGRLLKLIGGGLMLILGILLISRPEALSFG